MSSVRKQPRRLERYRKKLIKKSAYCAENVRYSLISKEGINHD